MSTSAHPEQSLPDDAPGTPAPDAPRSGPRRVLVVWTAVLAVLVLVVDQLTKWWAESSLVAGDATVPLLGSLLGLRLIYNPGAALSIATGMTWLLTIVVVVVVVVIVRMVRRIGSRAWAVALGLLLGGAVGNLADRLFREPGFARGHVVDFIAYANWFVGNVADIAIVAAAVMIALLSVLGIGLDGSRHGQDGRPADTGDAQHAGDDDAGDLPTVPGPDPAPTSEPTTTEREGER